MGHIIWHSFHQYNSPSLNNGSSRRKLYWFHQSELVRKKGVSVGLHEIQPRTINHGGFDTGETGRKSSFVGN